MCFIIFFHYICIRNNEFVRITSNYFRKIFIIILLIYDLALELTFPVNLFVTLVPILFFLTALISPSIFAVVQRKVRILLIVIFFKVFYESFFKKYIIRPNVPYDQRIIPFVFLFLIEIFPIKSTGSFFTTGNATYLFLIMSITIALSQISKKKI